MHLAGSPSHARGFLFSQGMSKRHGGSGELEIESLKPELLFIELKNHWFSIWGGEHQMTCMWWSRKITFPSQG